MEGSVILLTLKLAFLTCLLLSGLCLPLALLLSFKAVRGRRLIESIFNLPMVVPPVVFGFLVLLAISPSNPAAAWLAENTGIRLGFSFEGILTASLLYNFPFMINPLLNGFRKINAGLIEAAQTLGKGDLYIFINIIMPLSRRSVIAGLLLTFAHSVGQFGVVLMAGGNIPGQTKVLSIYLYELIEKLEYGRALLISGLLMLLMFLINLAAKILENRPVYKAVRNHCQREAGDA